MFSEPKRGRRLENTKKISPFTKSDQDQGYTLDSIFIEAGLGSGSRIMLKDPDQLDSFDKSFDFYRSNQTTLLD